MKRQRFCLYDCLYDEEKFNKHFEKLSKNNIELSIVHLNIRSLKSNSRGLCQFLQLLNLEFDVIILSEDWRNNIEFYRNILPGYVLCYDLPHDSNVGGVGIC